MKPYKVRWEIDVEASNPEQAAQEALKIHRDKASTATVFDVTDQEGKTTRWDCGPVDNA